MTRFFLFSLSASAAISLGIWCCLPGASAAAQNDRDESASMSIDFGAVVVGQVQERSFLLSNHGPTTWEGADVTVSCGCLRVLSRTEATAPGQTFEVRFALDPEGRLGAQHEVLTVHWANRQPLRVDLHATVVAELAIEPPWGLSATVGRGSAAFASTCMIAFGGAPPTTLTLADRSGFLRANAATITDITVLPVAGADWSRAVVSVQGTLPCDQEDLTASLLLRCDWGHRERVCNVPLHITRSPRLAVSPAVVFVAADAPGDRTIEVRLLSEDETLLAGLLAAADGGGSHPPKDCALGRVQWSIGDLRKWGTRELAITTTAGDMVHVPVLWE